MDIYYIVLTLVLLNHAQGSQGPESRLCFRWDRSVEHVAIHHAADDESSEDVYSTADIQGSAGHQVERCPKASNFCYALWQEDLSGNGSGVVIMGQGCWESSSIQDCERSLCVADKKPPRAMNNTKFCCCSGDLCNVNMTDMYVASDKARMQPPATEYLEQPPNENQIIIIVGSCVFILVSFVVVALVAYRLWQGEGIGKSAPDAVHLMENGGPGILSGGGYTVEHLKLAAIVGQGRYGSVWRGTVHDQEVAVKIFPSHYRNYFHNERDIYCLPFMDNPALLTYYGCDERVSIEGCVEYLLVLSYAPNGCLQDYLRANLLDWPAFCKMSLSVAKGLAHLHTDIRKGDKLKPCVSHRDLNSRNILIKADLSCCLCDLGFAMKISGSKYFYNGEEQHAETKSINDVGTLRYMAPEVLEGAVNLRDCESSLKQIDVYALGLVLWELASRCTDLYPPGVETPPYRLPFEAEVGHHPTFEQMQVLVSRHKARPLLPTWRDWAAIRLVRETVEDCWDQDAEARLTALCVEERLHELPAMWERHRGVSPTVNPTFGVGPQRGVNNHSVGQDTHRLFLDSGEDTGCSVRSGSQSSATFGKETRESTMSEGTVETMVTMSPSEPYCELPYKNSNHTAMSNGYGIPITSAALTASLQPHQGRNPCMERNLMLQAPSEEELSCNGNTLVDRSFKHVSSGHYLTSSSAFESQSLVSHDFLGQAVNNNSIRPATPIPYVQNAVYESCSVYATIPKQPNIPGNGSSIGTHADSGKPTSRWGSWGRNSGGWGGLRKLLDSKKRLLFGMYTSPKGRESRDAGGRNSSSGSKETEPPDGDEAKSNLLIRQNGIGLSPALKKSPMIMETQVCLLPSGKMGSGMSSKKNGVVTSVMSPLNQHSTRKEILISPTHDTKDINEDGTHEAKMLSKSRRPSTLPLVSVKPNCSSVSAVKASRQSLEEQFQQVFGTRNSQNASRLKDPNSRIKTPGDVPPSVRKNRGKGNVTARFSLYDDRMMDQSKTSPLYVEKCRHMLSNSVPDDMDISRSTCKACNYGEDVRLHNNLATSF